ncbi:FadR family transcriptional regulator [Bradyrhizobium jicamae]|uniref:FadR/GntR family transcriptional regulator n=1 Tax=Bradyrhizobium jicamae TaxID=280332 RepID=UPI001BA9EB91|nr:FCD domain-containing protein [Bradyrhizobium jicamae]MBR0751246.1 FadR family transcriptional regulator [Bradyrhizobium jicamae]
MIDQLEQYLASAPGGRLPAERQLAKDWAVSRNEVRKVLARLELEGRLIRKVGSGTFVRPQLADAMPDVSALRRVTSPRDAMEARLAVEPEAARLAAINASQEQIEEMRSVAQDIRASDGWADYRARNAQLHELIARASGNRLISVLQRIVDSVRASVVDKLGVRLPGPPGDYFSFAQHDAIIDAIERRDPEAAAEAMRAHLRNSYDRVMGFFT